MLELATYTLCTVVPMIYFSEILDVSTSTNLANDCNYLSEKTCFRQTIIRGRIYNSYLKDDISYSCKRSFSKLSEDHVKLNKNYLVLRWIRCVKTKKHIPS